MLIGRSGAAGVGLACAVCVGTTCAQVTAPPSTPAPAAPAVQPPVQPPVQPSAQPVRAPVNAMGDLPLREYALPMLPCDLLENNDVASQLASEVQADLEGYLRDLDIQNPQVEFELRGTLASALLVRGLYDEADAQFARARDVAPTEPLRLLMGHIIVMCARAKRDAGNDSAKAQELFEAAMRAKFEPIPWSVIGQTVQADRGSARLMVPGFVMERCRAAVDPGWTANNGKITFAGAQALLGMLCAHRYVESLGGVALKVYEDLINKNEGPLPDTWTPSMVELAADAPGSPVVVALFDGGFDPRLLGANAWTNPRETLNASDDDGNGIVDDVRGIAFDRSGQPVLAQASAQGGTLASGSPMAWRSPLMDMRSDPRMMRVVARGVFEREINLYSPSRLMLDLYSSRIPAANTLNMQQDALLYASAARGTHLASVVASGNPFARILSVERAPDLRLVPGATPLPSATSQPSSQLPSSAAALIERGVAYAAEQGARIIIVPWNTTQQDIVMKLLASNQGGDDQERMRVAEGVLSEERDAWSRAMAKHPGVLFIAAAPQPGGPARPQEMNPSNPANAAQAIDASSPASLDAPNFLLVGAITRSALPARFTNLDPRVTLYANALEVEGMMPDATSERLSGTPWAAATAANIAAKALALRPSLAPSELIQALRDGATPLPRNPGKSMLNARQTINP